MRERIKRYMDYKSISAGELAGLLEVQRSNISHILNGRNMPGAAFIEKLLLCFPDLNARWLLTGEGEMIEKKDSATSRPDSNQSLPEKESHGATRVDPIVKSVKSSVSENEAASPVDKIVLLFSDGTFIDYRKK